MKLDTFIEKANDLGRQRVPFIFVIDFERETPQLFTLADAARQTVLFQVKGVKNYSETASNPSTLQMDMKPVDYARYLEAFNRVMVQIQTGNSYLLNLTFPTELQSSHPLSELFYRARAPYKLYFKDQFIVFSPESFVKTDGNYIFSYPMKGTIDAALPDAAKQILENNKELWEHHTIVDLIRNDLAIISKNITVTRFRYISKIRTIRKNILQVSSEIRGELGQNWQDRIGENLIKLLPAGSISGAPKARTVEIIKDVEKIKRGFFTGIFGIFDGKNLDSAVNIRFIERTEGGLQFRSGGGITANSDAKQEYSEMLDKVYVPIG